MKEMMRCEEKGVLEECLAIQSIDIDGFARCCLVYLFFLYTCIRKCGGVQRFPHFTRRLFCQFETKPMGRL
jgi:hypothetical protein